jgi:hypothetical protein
MMMTMIMMMMMRMMRRRRDKVINKTDTQQSILDFANVPFLFRLKQNVSKAGTAAVTRQNK